MFVECVCRDMAAGGMRGKHEEEEVLQCTNNHQQ